MSIELDKQTQIIDWKWGDAPLSCGALSCAIGNFDGVHKGHQIIIEQAVHTAKAEAISSCVVTFSPHPRQYFRRNVVAAIAPLTPPAAPAVCCMAAERPALSVRFQRKRLPQQRLCVDTCAPHRGHQRTGLDTPRRGACVRRELAQQAHKRGARAGCSLVVENALDGLECKALVHLASTQT